MTQAIQETSTLPEQIHSSQENNRIRPEVLTVKKVVKKIFPYIIGLGIIVAGMGWLYGFTAVALPLTIGIGCGFGGGIVVGFISAKATKKGDRSIWAWFHQDVIKKLEEHGIRDLVIAVAVSVVLAIMVNSPYVGGALFGFGFGNHLVIALFSPKEDRRDRHSLSEVRLDRLEERVDELAHRRRRGSAPPVPEVGNGVDTDAPPKPREEELENAPVLDTKI